MRSDQARTPSALKNYTNCQYTYVAVKLSEQDLRWSELIECYQEGYQPEDGVDRLDGELLSRE